MPVEQFRPLALPTARKRRETYYIRVKQTGPSIFVFDVDKRNDADATNGSLSSDVRSAVRIRRGKSWESRGGDRYIRPTLESMLEEKGQK